MSGNFKNSLKNSMDTLCFSSGDKKRMYENLISAESEDTIMKKLTLPRAAAVAAACVVIMGGTAFAASKITTYLSSSNSFYDYESSEEINSAAASSSNEDVTMPEFPESIGGDYVFDGGNTVNVTGKDDNDRTVGKWDDLRAVYINQGGDTINLSMSYKPLDSSSTAPTELRRIDGIEVSYNFDEYLFLPPTEEYEELSEDIQSRLESDDHFFVSYGSEEPETIYFSGVLFEKDGITYNVYTNSDVSADTLFNIAEELIER